jgi:hypothetical protein
MPLQGQLVQESGTWTSRDSNTVILHPQSCLASGIQTVLVGSTLTPLPFKLTGSGYLAGSLIVVACPDSTVLAQHPVSGAVRLPLPVNLPPFDTGAWPLNLAK